jgi:hypothetical protein
MEKRVIAVKPGEEIELLRKAENGFFCEGWDSGRGRGNTSSKTPQDERGRLPLLAAPPAQSPPTLDPRLPSVKNFADLMMLPAA